MNYQLVYRDFLEGQLKLRQSRNNAFSMRAFAKLLGASPGAVSQVLNGKRPLTLSKALEWIDKLDVDDSTKELFLDAVSKDQTFRLNETEKQFRKVEEKYEYILLKLDKFEVINDWYHLAILNLTKIDSFQSDPEWIAKRLGIEIDLVEEAIKRLKRLKLLDIENGTLVRTSVSIETPSDIPSKAIRNFHKQNIERALQSLENDEVFDRDITSIMMPIDTAKLEEAKKRIKTFRKEMSAFLTSESSDSVYSMNIQLFPQFKGQTHA